MIFMLKEGGCSTVAIFLKKKKDGAFKIEKEKKKKTRKKEMYMQIACKSFKDSLMFLQENKKKKLKYSFHGHAYVWKCNSMWTLKAIARGSA